MESVLKCWCFDVYATLTGFQINYTKVLVPSTWWLCQGMKSVYQVVYSSGSSYGHP